MRTLIVTIFLLFSIPAHAENIKINVLGMVCDFCARGIEKTFYNDNDVKKVKVSLERGKVLIAYSLNKKVDLDEIKNIFLSNGQTATDIIIKNI